MHLHDLIRKNDINSIRVELSRSTENINIAEEKTGKTPLYIAVEERFNETVKLLLEWGANPDIEVATEYAETSETVIGFACSIWNIDALKILLDANASLDSSGYKNATFEWFMRICLIKYVEETKEDCKKIIDQMIENGGGFYSSIDDRLVNDLIMKDQHKWLLDFLINKSSEEIIVPLLTVIEHKIKNDASNNLVQKYSYIAGLIYNNPNSRFYNPDLALQYFGNCGEYLPALKAILPIYMGASFDNVGKIEDPYAFAFAQQTAATILTQEPDNQEAKNFLEREKQYPQSIKINENFNNIVAQPMKSLVFFTGITKEMHQTALFDRKNTQNENYAEDRTAAQQEWDRNYGLIISSDKDKEQGPSI